MTCTANFVVRSDNKACVCAPGQVRTATQCEACPVGRACNGGETTESCESFGPNVLGCTSTQVTACIAGMFISQDKKSCVCALDEQLLPTAECQRCPIGNYCDGTPTARPCTQKFGPQVSACSFAQVESCEWRSNTVISSNKQSCDCVSEYSRIRGVCTYNCAAGSYSTPRMFQPKACE